MTITIKRRFKEVSSLFVYKSAPSIYEIKELLKATEELLAFNAKCDIKLELVIGDNHDVNKTYN